MNKRLVVLGVLAVIILLAVIKVNLHYYKDKDEIVSMSKVKAKEYCIDKKYNKNTCNNLKMDYIEGPVNYGPTDGPDEYFGNWFTTFKLTDKTSSDIIYVVSDLEGKIKYINQTEDLEYPYCTNGYYHDKESWGNPGGTGEKIPCPSTYEEHIYCPEAPDKNSKDCERIE